MPGTAGAYELRYVSADQTIVARRPITVTEAPVSLSAPEQAIVGQLVPVHWVGPEADYDNVQLRLPGDDSYLTYDYVPDNNPVTLRMPDAPGTYELVYMFNDSEVIATRPIEVVPEGTAIAPLAASLSAPDETEANSDVQVGWSGPGASGDYIILRLPGDTGYLSYAYARGNNPVTLPTPVEAGPYELVYRFADDRELAVRPIMIVNEVTPDQPQALVEARFVVPADYADMPIQWSAVPLPGQTVSPDAWAMNEWIVGPVTASFEPGVYQVDGAAEGMRFSAEVTIARGSENRFVIAPTGAGGEVQ